MARMLKILGFVLVAAFSGQAVAEGAKSSTVPRFEPQPFWPKPLPGRRTQKFRSIQ
jgi:hypothetical protein